MCPRSQVRSRSGRPSSRIALLAGALVLAPLAAVGTVGGGSASAEPVTLPAPRVAYAFDDLGTPGSAVPDGSTVADAGALATPAPLTGNGATSVPGVSGRDDDRALNLPGGTPGSGAPFVTIPAGAVPAGTADVTLSAWVRWRGFPDCTWPYALGTSSGTYLASIAGCGTGKGEARLDGGATIAAGFGSKLPASTWAHAVVVLRGGTSISSYLNGTLVETTPVPASYTASAVAGGTGSLSGYIGRSFFGADEMIGAGIDDVRVYDVALDDAQVRQVGTDGYAALVDADAGTGVRLPASTTTDLTLPTRGASGTTVTWSSSDPAVISDTGTVDRPASGEPAAVVTMTPTFAMGGVSAAGTPAEVRVAPLLSSSDALEAAVAAVESLPVFAAPLSGSVTLPEDEAGLLRQGAALDPEVRDIAISWATSDASVITAEDTGVAPDVLAKGLVTRHAEPRTATLTATISSTTDTSLPARTATVEVTVPASAVVAEEDLEAYAFTYFTGDNIDGEKIRFAVSQGNDALQWDTLNGGRPVLESTEGDMGLRDPFIMRSAEGDRFFLIATDLSVGRKGWGGATNRGSLHLEIWESTDLVNWGEQRHVQVSTPNLGMTWAPEAIYDPSIGAYLVYWTSSEFTDATRNTPVGNNPKLYYATTRDFRTFSEPQEWLDASDVPGSAQGGGLIDASMIEEDGTFYRFAKNTPAAGCPSADIFGMRSTTPRATGDGWTMISDCIGRTAGTPEVEGPHVFRANEGDVNGHRYYLWVDNYGGIGYIPLFSESLDAPTWQRPDPSTYRLPASPRHGGILRITRAERDAMVGATDPQLLVTSVAETRLEALATDEVTLPAEVTATFGDGRTAAVPVTWDAFSLGDAAPGDEVTVTGRLDNGAATPATAVITVTAPPATFMVATEPGTPTGANGWYTTPVEVAATAVEGAEPVLEHSTDGETWTAGGSVTVETDGVSVVRFRDAASPGVVVSTSVGVDRVDPVPLAELVAGDRTLRLSGTDVTAGVASLRYRLPGGAWTAYTAPVSVPETVRSVAVQVVDRAGNTATEDVAVPWAAPLPGQYGVGSRITPQPLAAFGKLGTAKPIAVYYRGEDGADVSGTVYVTIRRSGTSQLIATAHAYRGGTTQVATPRIPNVKGRYEVTMTFVPSNAAYRASVRRFSIWATPSGRP